MIWTISSSKGYNSFLFLILFCSSAFYSNGFFIPTPQSQSVDTRKQNLLSSRDFAGSSKSKSFFPQKDLMESKITLNLDKSKFDDFIIDTGDEDDDDNAHNGSSESFKKGAQKIILEVDDDDSDGGVYGGDKMKVDAKSGYNKNAFSTLSLEEEKRIKKMYENPETMTFSELNTIFQPKGVKHSNLLRTFASTAVIYRLDGILVDTIPWQLDAWNKVAETMEFPLIDQELVVKSLLMSPYNAIQSVFEWTDDVKERSKCVIRFQMILSTIISNKAAEDLVRPMDNVEFALETMLYSNIPLGVVSNLPVEIMLEILEKAKLQDFINVVVGYDSELKFQDQLLLRSCLEIEKPPKHCFFCDFHTQSFIQAHELDLKAVAAVGNYNLENNDHLADAKIIQVSDLTPRRIRDILGNFPFDAEDFYSETVAMYDKASHNNLQADYWGDHPSGAATRTKTDQEWRPDPNDPNDDKGKA
jgi:phosphoglycolate phosphatase-like HAD superfamily hydrolase